MSAPSPESTGWRKQLRSIAGHSGIPEWVLRFPAERKDRVMSDMADTSDAPSGAVIIPAPPRTRWLLALGLIAGPLCLVVGLIQALTREGFDPTRHDLSLLANGELGWIQITNLVLSGLMVIAAAIGMSRVMRTGRGATWGPRLIGSYGRRTQLRIAGAQWLECQGPHRPVESDAVAA
jgi:hypothetical protein